MLIEIIGELPAVAAHGLGVDICAEFLSPYLIGAFGSHPESFHNHIARLAYAQLFARVVPCRHCETFGIKHKPVHIENNRSHENSSVLLKKHFRRSAFDGAGEGNRTPVFSLGS